MSCNSRRPRKLSGEGFTEAAAGSCPEKVSGAGGDFGKVEEAAHAALLKMRFFVMSAGLALSSQSSRRTYHCPACGKALHGWSLAERRVVTAEGEASYHPVRCRCLACAQDYYPLEEANGLSGSQFTTGAKALIGKAGAQTPYAHVSEWLLEERGLPVSAKEVDRTVREVASWRMQEEEQLRGAVFGEEAAHLRAAGEDPLEAAPKAFGV